MKHLACLELPILLQKPKCKKKYCNLCTTHTYYDINMNIGLMCNEQTSM